MPDKNISINKYYLGKPIYCLPNIQKTGNRLLVIKPSNDIVYFLNDISKVVIRKAALHSHN